MPRPRPAGSAELVVTSEEGTPVKVAVGVTSGLTLQFDADESGLSVLGSDRSVKPEDDKEDPWVAKIVEGGVKYPLVHLTVTRPGLSTSFTIVTSKRLILLDVKSVMVAKYRLVRWHPQEPQVAVSLPRPEPFMPARYHVGYTLEPVDGGPVWKPIQVLDDGRRTYVVFPRNLSVMAYPMARLIGANGPELINPHLVEHVMVIDHLIPSRLELRLGSSATAEVVTITRTTPTSITCPGDVYCPQWSATVAAQLGR